MKSSELGAAVLGGSILVVGEFRNWAFKPTKKGDKNLETYSVLVKGGTQLLNLKQTSPMNGHAPQHPGFKVGDKIVCEVGTLEHGDGFLSGSTRPSLLQ